MFAGPYTTGSVVMSPRPTSTSWFNTEMNLTAPPTTTYVFNSTLASLLHAITTLCPIQPSDLDEGWTIADLPDECEDLLDPYCYPDVDQPPPRSTLFPVECSPGYYSDTSSISSSTGITTPSPASDSTTSGSAKPSPIEPETVASCTQFYKVVRGDSCADISSRFDITLKQVRSIFSHASKTRS